MFKKSVLASQKTYCISITKFSRLMPLREIAAIDVYCINTINANILFGQNGEFFNVEAGGAFNG
jgi:hypothetical protein